MTETELRSTIADMLKAEHSPEPDWVRIELLALETIKRLNAGVEPAYPVEIYRFLDDVDIRRKDILAGRNAYADKQYADVTAYLGDNGWPA